MTDDNREAPIVSRSSEFVRIAGLRFDEISGRRIRGFIDLGEHHHTPWGVAHGGGRDHGQRGASRSSTCRQGLRFAQSRPTSCRIL